MPSGDKRTRSFIKAYRALDSFREIALLYMAASDCCKQQRKLPVAQGRRPPSSDVDAIEAENFGKWRRVERNFKPWRT